MHSVADLLELFAKIKEASRTGLDYEELLAKLRHIVSLELQSTFAKQQEDMADPRTVDTVANLGVHVETELPGRDPIEITLHDTVVDCLEAWAVENVPIGPQIDSVLSMLVAEMTAVHQALLLSTAVDEIEFVSVAAALKEHTDEARGKLAEARRQLEEAARQFIANPDLAFETSSETKTDVSGLGVQSIGQVAVGKLAEAFAIIMSMSREELIKSGELTPDQLQELHEHLQAAAISAKPQDSDLVDSSAPLVGDEAPTELEPTTVATGTDFDKDVDSCDAGNTPPKEGEHEVSQAELAEALKLIMSRSQEELVESAAVSAEQLRQLRDHVHSAAFSATALELSGEHPSADAAQWFFDRFKEPDLNDAGRVELAERSIHLREKGVQMKLGDKPCKLGTEFVKAVGRRTFRVRDAETSKRLCAQVTIPAELNFSN